jgi:hypothetical protein
MKIISLSACVWLFLTSPLYLRTEVGWHGIIPLQSTRADVERLLGRSADPSGCIYKTQHEVVFIEYAQHSCKDNPEGWNVPGNTVMLISVASKTELRLTDLNINLATYKKTEDTEMPGRYYYFNEEKGILIIALGNGMVGSINYQPTKDDNNLRCRE